MNEQRQPIDPKTLAGIQSLSPLMPHDANVIAGMKAEYNIPDQAPSAAVKADAAADNVAGILHRTPGMDLL